MTTEAQNVKPRERIRLISGVDVGEAGVGVESNAAAVAESLGTGSWFECSGSPLAFLGPRPERLANDSP
jgi:hypothetical protein